MRQLETGAADSGTNGYKVVGGLNSMGNVIASVGETGAADSGMHNLYIIWVQSGRRPDFGG